MAPFEFTGSALRCQPLAGHAGFAEVVLDLQGDSVNKFNALTLGELRDVVRKLKSETQLRGVLFTSAKDVFVVGADVTEFLGYFKQSEAEL
ncbi:MAG: fatty acid oxidation complex subunit alpha FadB, partial [Bdellovibrionota bacterium]